MTEVRFRAEARVDVAEAFEWYQRARSGLGVEFLEAIEAALDVVALSPLTWPVWPGSSPRDDVRHFPLRRFPYAIAYIVSGDVLLVLAVAHNRRRPGFWRDRLA